VIPPAVKSIPTTMRFCGFARVRQAAAVFKE
jgi:hypothetical protein